MNLIERLGRGLLVLDGAMGTQIAAHAVPAAAWRGREGCNEWLCLTAPDLIRGIHRAYLEAGCDVIETNSFGASPITLAEYGLAERAAEINRAAARLAREAADAASSPQNPRYVLGSVGPGNKLPTFGQIGFDELCDAFRIQIEGLLEGGADGIILETCQDPLAIKAGLVAFDKTAGSRPEKLLYVSITVEPTGTLLVGSTIAALVALLAPFPIHVLGLNCGTGPEAMRIHLDYLAQHWPGAIGCMPNAGLPVWSAGRATYPLGPEEFARRLSAMAREVGLQVVGGCCGTTPDHIRALRRELQGFVPPARRVERRDQVSSVFQPADLSQEPPPLFIGERANATGSRKFREALLAGDYEACFQILVEQEDEGAHVVDLSCAYAGRDEVRDVRILVARAAQGCRLPLMVDSTQPEVHETALKLYGGRLILNSIHFESGEERARHVVNLARRYGAVVVGLAIDEQGMAMTANRKLEVAHRLVRFGEAHGLRRGDLLIDPLTFSVASGDPSLRTAARETLEAIRRIKAELPGVRTVLGLSNVSYGLTPPARRVLNAVFLDRCLKAGLDACILNVAALMPPHEIPPEAARRAAALLDYDTTAGDPLERFVALFAEGAMGAAEPPPPADPATALAEAVQRGRASRALEALATLLQERPATEILNEVLLPAMERVGALFNEGALPLPFVLKSAEVMKQMVERLRPHLGREGTAAASRGTMVLATVAGDVHDIGKNLVDIVLSNNGFTVVNLGVKVPVEQMIAAVREHRADVLGMSGLLVKSATVMAENLRALESAGLRLPVFLGGAALTPAFVAETCQPLYSGPVVYCRDAFEGLTRMREFMEKGHVPKTVSPAAGRTAAASEGEAPARAQVALAPPPRPPFWGARVARDVPLDAVFAKLDERALWARWGFRRGEPAATFEERVRRELRPRLEELKNLVRRERIFRPQAAYGYFQCRAAGDTLWILRPEGGEPVRFVFPRQRRPPYLAIPDFFRPDEDVVGILVVTLGDALAEGEARRYRQGRYEQYFLLHGLAVETTEALAEYWHDRMRHEVGVSGGARYGFGYPACPDLAMNRVLCELVRAEQIGVSVTEHFAMVPEMTTAALVAFHPEARHFAVETGSEDKNSPGG